MKKKSDAPRIKEQIRPEYEFDYARSRRNRFASRMKQDAVTIVLEPDVARVFDNSESVNRLLRSIITAVPTTASRVANGKRRTIR